MKPIRYCTGKQCCINYYKYQCERTEEWNEKEYHREQTRKKDVHTNHTKVYDICTQTKPETISWQSAKKEHKIVNINDETWKV